MASTIKLKNSNTEGNAPSSLEQGEVAINVNDGNLFYGDGSSVLQNFTFNHVTASGDISASGDLEIRNITASGNINASGEFIGASINVTNVTASIVSSSGNIIAANVHLPGGATISFDDSLDGTDQTLIELEGQFSEGQRIILHDDDIYVGGYFQNGSCYWKNGEKFNLTTNADSMTWGIEFDSENNIYNVGYYMKSHNLIPAFWKNKRRVNLNRPRHGDGEAKYIKILGSKKIIAGTVMAPHNFLGYLTKPTYWTNGARTSCQIGSVDDGWQNSDVFDLFIDEEENIHGGAMWARMPITALVGDTEFEEWPEPMAVHDAQPWDCSSHHHAVYVIDRATPCPWLAKIDGNFFPARYMFTVDYTESEIADDPAQHKQSHVLELLDAGEWTGNIVALPNNRVRVTHPAWFEYGQGAPDFRPSAHIHYSKSDLDYTLDVNRVFDNLYNDTEDQDGDIE